MIQPKRYITPLEDPFEDEQDTSKKNVLTMPLSDVLRSTLSYLKVFLAKRSFFLLLIFFCLSYGFFLARPIDLTNSDVGRRLKDGEILISALRAGSFSQAEGVLTRNSYSYTAPDFPFMNLNWGTGVLFFIVKQGAGFSGLSLVNIAFCLVAFVLMFLEARRKSNTLTASLLSLLLIPLMGERWDIRPEIFTFVLSAVYFVVLSRWRDGILPAEVLWVLVPLQILWVNVHGGFFLGIVIIGCFLAEAVLSGRVRLRAGWHAGAVFGSLIAVSFINPFGYRAVLLPVTIFRHLRFSILEHQASSFPESIDEAHIFYWIFRIGIVVFILSAIGALFRRPRRFPLAFVLLGMAFGIMAWFSVGNISLFALMTLPVASACIQLSIPKMNNLSSRTIKMLLLGSVCMAAIAVLCAHGLMLQARLGSPIRVGTLPGMEKGAEFLLNQNVKGRILNNSGMGSYLIYYLYPHYHVFVDGWPDAYPDNFNTVVYKTLLDDERTWKWYDKQYGIGAIFFSKNDRGEESQKFLAARMQESRWSKVYIDNYCTVLIK